jgi:Mlc titration factor MtfA (ptsG expression regulator)
MSALAVVLGLALAAALAALVPRWRLQRALARPLPPGWRAILLRNVAPYARMAAPLQSQVEQTVKRFLHQKKFVGCDGLVIDDEMRVTVAGHASVLLLNRPNRAFPELHAVLLYPTAFLVPRAEVDAAGVVTPGQRGLLGESWGDGRVILAWDHVPRPGHSVQQDGQNVVLHEFAHQLDSESGSNNGAPFLGHHARYQRWSAVLSRDFANLQHAAAFAQYGAPHDASGGVLDPYGATSPAEFFAVATEAFFEKPHQMAERHGELYEQFSSYYQVDPRQWQPAPPPAAPAPAPTTYNTWF